MTDINICLEIVDNNIFSNTKSDYEDKYQKIYKSLFACLYNNPGILLTLSLSGGFLSFLYDKHPEAVEILREVVERGQIEFLGGGFYNPIFPLLFPVDRTGQIEKMNTVLRSCVGIRPRGMSVFGSIWDPSLVSTFKSCGIEYVNLDSTLIPSSEKKVYPIVSSDRGKILYVLPVYDSLLPKPKENAEQWVNRLKKSVGNASIEGECPVVTLAIKAENFSEFASSDYFEYINKVCNATAEENFGIKFTLPQIYLKNARHFIPSYIPAGMEWKIGRWARKPYEICDNNTRFPITIYDYLNLYKQDKCLYDRMMYLSLMITQSHGGDKLRKNAAKEKLWESQCGYNFLISSTGLPSCTEQRQKAYRLLNETDRLIRDSNKFKESVTSYDYDGDGLAEYVCRINNLHIVISKTGGTIKEFDLINGSNYAASLSRYAKFDALSDNFNRGIFVEHIYDESQMHDYVDFSVAPKEVFAGILFDEKRFSPQRKEIILEARGTFSSLEVPVSLVKKYSFSDGCVSVQYILKNESPLPVKGMFVVEANFAQTLFNNLHKFQYDAEIVLNESRKTIAFDGIYAVDKGVSALRISDRNDKMQLNFEPNEECGFLSNNLVFKRSGKDEQVAEDSRTLVTSFFWSIDLPANRAIEKTINLSLVPFKTCSK